MRRGLIGLNLNEWIEVYQYHLEHPEASTWLVANSFNISQKHVRNIYSYMEDGDKH
jgi:hypothetical protein